MKCKLGRLLIQSFWLCGMARFLDLGPRPPLLPLCYYLAHTSLLPTPCTLPSLLSGEGGKRSQLLCCFFMEPPFQRRL